MEVIDIIMIYLYNIVEITLFIEKKLNLYNCINELKLLKKYI